MDTHGQRQEFYTVEANRIQETRIYIYIYIYIVEVNTNFEHYCE